MAGEPFPTALRVCLYPSVSPVHVSGPGACVGGCAPRARFLAYARGACSHRQSPVWGARGPGHLSGQSPRSLAAPRNGCLASQMLGNAPDGVLSEHVFCVAVWVAWAGCEWFRG